jgi:hypothetical protein
MSASPQDLTPLVLKQPEIPRLAEIGQQIDTFRGIALELQAQAKRAVIDSEKTFAVGTDLLTLVKTHGDELEKLRKAIKAPIDAYAKTIQAIFLPILDEFTTATNEMKRKMTAYRIEQDRIVREEQERARKQQEEEALARAAELEKQGNTKAADAVMEMAAAPLAAPQKTEARRGSFGGKAGTTETWTAEIVNMRAFLTSVLSGETNFNLDNIEVSKMALNSLAKAVKVEGIKNGVKIIKSTGLTLRS